MGMHVSDQRVGPRHRDGENEQDAGRQEGRGKDAVPKLGWISLKARQVLRPRVSPGPARAWDRSTTKPSGPSHPPWPR